MTTLGYLLLAIACLFGGVAIVAAVVLIDLMDRPRPTLTDDFDSTGG